MAAFYSLLCKAIKKQPAGRSGRLFWRSGRDSNPRAIARKLISSQPRYDHFDTAAYSISLPVQADSSGLLCPESLIGYPIFIYLSILQRKVK